MGSQASERWGAGARSWTSRTSSRLPRTPAPSPRSPCCSNLLPQDRVFFVVLGVQICLTVAFLSSLQEEKGRKEDSIAKQPAHDKEICCLLGEQRAS